MPWKDFEVLDQRMLFISSCLEKQDSMAALCRQFGVSRRIGYKWLSRYRGNGPEALSDQSRAPHLHPNQVEAELERRILSQRVTHPTWGARKLLASLARSSTDEPILWPAASTVGQMLKRAGLAHPRRRCRGSETPPPGLPVSASTQGPNHLWCADFKGWFRTGDGSRCDPLTISDAHSRYLLRCQATHINHKSARGLFEATFREFGLPDAIRTDNGEPFASVGLLGLSRLTIWWIRLGILHQRIDPGCPQQNGSHERMHGTLKRQVASPPARSLRAQQARFDSFCAEYNQERPHEGLPGMATPASLYRPSVRPYPQRLPELPYAPGHQLRRVDRFGKFSWNGQSIRLSKVLREQVIGIKALEPSACDSSPKLASENFWMVRFGTIELGILDIDRGRMLRPRERRHLLATTGPE
jgi:transposase InsO family protein